MSYLQQSFNYNFYILTRDLFNFTVIENDYLHFKHTILYWKQKL